MTSGTNRVRYSYLANAPLVDKLWFTNGSTLRMTTSKQYDLVNRLAALTNNAGGSNVSVFNYAYNTANQRTAVTNADNSRWAYGYDSLGQVTSGKKYWSDHAAVSGQQFDYTFDTIGNRKTTTRDTRVAYYTNNGLNQLTGRTVPGYVNILGDATNTATVTVNLQATERKGTYYRAELTVANSSSPVWLGVTNIAVLNQASSADVIATNIGNVYVPGTPELFSYDPDGNLTNDGRFSYAWDAENRPLTFTRVSSAPSGSKVKLDCAYDLQWRRTQKIVSGWNGSAYTAQSTNKFIYDGWNLIAILDHTNGLVQTFSWGSDLSGSLQGAGGVGGLISMTFHQGTNAGTYYYCFDGNGNVAGLINATNGAVEAVYEYEPFLKLLRATGRLAFVNPFVGSTKYCDWETGLLYYGYRYYDPSTGRWFSRDPLGERGGLNTYGFCRSDACNRHDQFGLFTFDVKYNVNWPAISPIWPNDRTTGLTQVLDRSYTRDKVRKSPCVEYKVEAKAKYAIYYKEGVDPTIERTPGGTTLEGHEIMHVASYNGPLVAFESTFNGYKVCCGEKCIREFENWMSAAFEVAKYQGEYDSVGYDLGGEYLPNDPAIPDFQARQAALLRDLKNATLKEASAKQKFDRCVQSATGP